MRERRLGWDGCLNVRDLGGHATEDGRVTRFGAVVRADSVRRLTPQGWRQLTEYGVARIVDLRHADELASDPPGELGVETVHVPVLPDPAWPEWAALEARVDAIEDPAAGKAALYLEFLDRFADGFAAAISAVAAAGPGAVVVHCLVGKDRTGLVSALLLRLVGVAPAHVAADYALSEHSLRTLSDPWVAAGADEAERKRRRRIAAAPARAMEDVLDELDRRGGVGAYLREAGVAAGELQRVRTRLVG